MSESQYEAMRAFIRVAVELEVKKAIPEARTALLSEVRASLPPETRSEAIPGPPGKDGKDGIDGKDGRDGKDGALGERGTDGLNGKDGAPSMVPGAKGDTGERGADGIATREELVSTVEERVADIRVRTLADSYREVFKDGELYKRGEFVTWGGSLFIALKPETRSKPGESADWKLVVKRGADGKDTGNRR